jgi:membrane-bound lytic murein transglycosylase B
MTTYFPRKKFAVVLAVLLLLVGTNASAQLTMSQNPTATTTAETQALQLQLQAIEIQISQFQQQLQSIQGQKNTLQNKIAELQKQQATLQLQIQASNLQISNLESQQSETQTLITQQTTKEQQLDVELAGVLQSINQQDSYPFLYTLVNQSDLSNALDALESYTQVSDSLSGLLTQVTQTKNQLNTQQAQLAQQQSDTGNFLAIQTLQQQQLADSVSQQATLLQQTNGKENDYQITLNDTQKQADAIRNRLYELSGVSTQVTFGQALQIATTVSSETGVRPAFLLAILTQESDLGKNVGTCNRSGDPPSKSYKVVMNPARDIPPFLQITQALGINPATTPISCPMHDSQGNQEGWGGAMGPAQFIPSTWVGYQDKVSAITGKPANPWDINDAFLAAGIKLADDGATTQSGEWDAAMRYFSGGTNPKYSFYGDSVVAQAQSYQTDIDNLNQ